MKEQDLALPLATAQTLADYLAQRPYREVYQLIGALQQLKPAMPESQPKEPEENEPNA